MENRIVHRVTEPLTPEKEEAQRKQDHELYLKTREAYAEAEGSGEESYDKWILTLAGGALGLSMTFLKDISAHPAHTPGFIFTGWVLLALSIACILTNLRLCPHLQAKYRKILDHRFSSTNYDPAEDNWDKVQRKQNKITLTIVTDILNWTSLGFFFLGLLFIAVFALLNLG